MCVFGYMPAVFHQLLNGSRRPGRHGGTVAVNSDTEMGSKVTMVSDYHHGLCAAGECKINQHLSQYGFRNKSPSFANFDIATNSHDVEMGVLEGDGRKRDDLIGLQLVLDEDGQIIRHAARDGAQNSHSMQPRPDQHAKETH